MSFKEFLKDKVLLICLILFGVASIEIFLLAYKMAIGMRIYIGLAPILMLFIALIIEYVRKKDFMIS